ncbi:MAG: DUF4199 family protein, partial [Thermoanaerobaculia bacterium]|nr:DUF4199 family protein [Thermoanaerobaculia bacterium]
FVMGFTGWYLDPSLLNLFFLVIPIQVSLLVVGLRSSAAENGYGRQVFSGTLASLLASVLIFGGSIFFTTVVFPSYFDELRAVHATMLEQAGKSAEEVRAQVEAMAETQTPFLQALFGAIGTVVTGLVSSLVIAAFARKR